MERVLRLDLGKLCLTERPYGGHRRPQAAVFRLPSIQMLTPGSEGRQLSSIDRQVEGVWVDEKLQFTLREQTLPPEGAWYWEPRKVAVAVKTSFSAEEILIHANQLEESRRLEIWLGPFARLRPVEATLPHFTDAVRVLVDAEMFSGVDALRTRSDIADFLSGRLPLADLTQRMIDRHFYRATETVTRRQAHGLTPA